MQRLARLVVDRPRTLVLLLALATAAALGGAAGVEVDDVPRSFFRSEDRDFARLEEVYRDFGSDDNECLVLLECEEVFTPEVADCIRALEADLGPLPGVARVLSLDDVPTFGDGPLPRRLLPHPDAPPEVFARARATAMEHPLVADQILSADGKTTLLVVRLDPTLQSIASIRPVVDGIRESLARHELPGTRLRLSGIPPIRVVIFETIKREQGLFAILGAGLGFAIGWLVFRRLGPILITSCASILAGCLALGCFRLLGHSINILNGALPLLIMVIALTDAVHLMIDILRSRHAGLSVRDAARDAVRHLGVPCALTSLTTAIGFGSLAISRVEVIRDFGILFTVAVSLSFLVVLTTVPALSVLFLRAGPRTGFDSGSQGLGKLAERVFRGLVNRARPVSALGTLATLGLLGVSSGLTPDNRLIEAAPGDAESVRALQAGERAFGGVLTTSVLCEWAPGGVVDGSVFAAIRGVQAALDAQPFFHGSLSVLDLLDLFPAGGAAPPGRESVDPGNARLPSLALLPADLVRRTFRPDLGRALVSARAPDSPSRIAGAAYRELERSLDTLRAAHPGIELHVTGTDAIARRNVNVMISDFALGLGLAALVIFGVLSLAFRSVRIGALSVLPNVFPLVVAASGLTLAGLELQMTSVIAFTVCLGLAVDDTIHLVARYQRTLREVGDPAEAGARSALDVGRALVVTTAILLGGFAVLGFSEVPTTRLFAAICGTGLVAALIGDLLFLPALLVAFGPRPRPRDAANVSAR